LVRVLYLIFICAMAYSLHILLCATFKRAIIRLQILGKKVFNLSSFIFISVIHACILLYTCACAYVCIHYEENGNDGWRPAKLRHPESFLEKYRPRHAYLSECTIFILLTHLVNSIYSDQWKVQTWLVVTFFSTIRRHQPVICSVKNVRTNYYL